MNEKYSKYLPLGTVVLLKGGKKRLMIMGFCSMADNDRKKVYDYSGVLYPEGYLNPNQVCLFDHNQIDKIYCLGLSDAEEKHFKVELNKLVNSLNDTKKEIKNENGQDFLEN